MSQDQDKKAASRRQFFKAAGLGAVAAGAGALGAPAPAAAAAAASPDVNPGYSETAHVKTYYALAK